MDPVVAKHIEKTEGVCGGKPRIAGHRIRVQDIAVWHERHGMSPDDIVAEFPQLTLANVHAALAYYFDHREDIRRDIEEADQILAESKVRHPSKLSPKMGNLDGPKAQVSP
jgi:uncharacterized protein (DUF433 family)